MVESIFRFHHYIEILIFHEYVRRCLQITNVVFSIIIPENLKKIFVNNERK